MKALHMITADPQRTPTLTMFAHPTGSSSPRTELRRPCHHRPDDPPTSTFAWNHGGIQPEIRRPGRHGRPGVRTTATTRRGRTTRRRPTMLDLVGLGDSYVHDGRV
jgi:hypothetical protein